MVRHLRFVPAAPEYRSPVQKPQLMELTSTRFVAAMAVLLGHFSDLLALPPLVSQLISGGIGVSFFFVLSGFILCYRYWDTFADGINLNKFRRYFVARIARVYPLYVVALFLITGLYLTIVAVNPRAIDFPPNPLVSWLANLLAVQTFAPTRETQQFWNGPSWSVSTEFGFYLMLPLILAGIAKYVRNVEGLILLLVLAIAAGVVAQASTLTLVLGFGWDRVFWLDTVARRNIFWLLPEFVTGVVTARLLFGGHLSWLGRAGARNMLLIGSVSLVLLLNLLPWPTDDRAFIVMQQFRLDLGYMIPFAGVIVALAAGPTILSALLRSPASVILGEASYALYIFHWIPWTALAVMKALGVIIHPVAVAVIIILTVLASIGSYLWFERPVRSYLRQVWAVKSLRKSDIRSASAHSRSSNQDQSRYSGMLSHLFQKINNWRFADFAAAIFVLVVGVAYIANTWSPSSYGEALVSILGESQSGPDLGRPRPIRSDEWWVVTPLTQATINNGFERINRTSLYGEDLRINYGLPIHDWGIAFKPTMWLYGWVNPAYAYSFHWFALYALFILGHALLFRWFGAGPVLAYALAAGLYYTGFVQFWWNEKGPIFALFPWVILPLATRFALGWKAAIMYWVAVAWLLTNFYPPLQVPLAFAGFILVLARKPDLFKPIPMTVLVGAITLAAGTSALYLWDYLQATATTIYPGSRIVSGGTVPGRFWLSWLLPAVNFSSNYSSLIGRNICEIGTVGLYYSLLIMCFADIRRWRQVWTNTERRRRITILSSGLALMLCWMALPLPPWVGAPLLWNHVQPERMQYVAGLLFVMLIFVIIDQLGLRITLVRAAVFCGLILSAWLTWNNTPGQDHYEDLLILVIGLPAIVIARRWPYRAHESMAIASLLAGVWLFGRFNPLQSAWPIFNRSPNAWTQAMDQLAAENNGVLAVTGVPGAIANGQGYRSVSHVTAVPQLKFWRSRFPELPEAEFNAIFNRYSRVDVLDEDAPRMVYTDTVGVPVDLFQKTAPVRYALQPMRKLPIKGHVDAAVVEDGNLVVVGWGPWRGPLTSQELEVTLTPASSTSGAPRRSLVVRKDLPPATHQEYSGLNGFSLRIPLIAGAPRPAVCIVAYDRSTGHRALLTNPAGLAYCEMTD